MNRSLYALICFLLLFCNLDVSAQSKELKGNVRDEKGPLLGISVQVKNTPRGTTTNASGDFTLHANAGEILVFSSTGYMTQEIAVDDRVTYNITLVANAQSMNEVVVVGYGTKKRQFLAGAVSSVSGDALKSRPVTNARSGLQGKKPRLFIHH
jgi:hypothetical protein